MRILMLGNSFTFYHDMPETLARLLQEEVVANTRGGAMLAEQCNSETEMGGRTFQYLTQEKWDYVVLQEQSNAPVTKKKSFLKSVATLCPMIRSCGAVPVLYATWAYRDGSEKLKSINMSYEDMYQQMTEAYHFAAAENHCPVADVGMAFHALAGQMQLYEEDDYHPSEAGSLLAAGVLAATIREDAMKKL